MRVRNDVVVTEDFYERAQVEPNALNQLCEYDLLILVVVAVWDIKRDSEATCWE